MKAPPLYDVKTVREWIAFQKRYDVLWQTIYNGAVRMSWRQKDVDQEVYYFGMRVPAGRQLIVYDRTLKVSQGAYDIDVVVPSGGFTGGTLAYKSMLNPGNPDGTVTADLYAGVTPSGTLDVKDADFIDTGTGVGVGRAGGAPSVDGVVAVVRGESLLRVTRAVADPYTVAIRLIAWEEDTTE